MQSVNNVKGYFFLSEFLLSGYYYYYSGFAFMSLLVSGFFLVAAAVVVGIDLQYINMDTPGAPEFFFIQYSFWLPPSLYCVCVLHTLFMVH